MSGLLRCEISGEIMNNTIDDPFVVTPSGHIAKRRLLLQKLIENGNIDPFVINNDVSSTTTTDQQQQQQRRISLTEDDLIVLQQQQHNLNTNNTSQLIPPLPRSVIPQQQQVPQTAANGTTNGNSTSSTSIGTGTDMGSLLKLVQIEYDTIVLELFDTRKQLQHVRQELSQALYQNDAAVRVIARLTSERNEARVSGPQQQVVLTTATEQSNESPSFKRPRLSDDAVQQDEDQQTKVSIPTSDLDIMLSTWEQLHSSRKGRQKVASKQALPISTLTNADAYRAMTIPVNATTPIEAATVSSDSCGRYICSSTATCDLVSISDTQVVLLSKESNTYTTTIETNIQPDTTSMVRCIDSDNSHKTLLHAMGLYDGTVLIYNNTNQIGSLTATKSTVVDVRIHPDLIHIIATTSDGTVQIARINDEKDTNTNNASSVEWVAKFQLDAATTNTDDAPLYSAGALHPDGLIYITGTANSGELHIWDFKSQVCAERLRYLQQSDDTVSVSVRSITISNNGYHVAVIYSNNAVVVWDLRKLQIVATLNNNENSTILQHVSSVVFDNSGKYLAYSGINQHSDDDKNTILATVTIAIVNVKDWSLVTMLQVADSTLTVTESSSPSLTASSGITWGNDNKISVVWGTTMIENPSKEKRNVAVFQQDVSATD